MTGRHNLVPDRRLQRVAEEEGEERKVEKLFKVGGDLKMRSSTKTAFSDKVELKLSLDRSVW